MAAETLVAAHERTLERWKQEKPEQIKRLAPPVRADPIYRPLAPTQIEETFYRDRSAHIESLPRYRIHDLSEVWTGHICAQYRVAAVEDRHRMGVFRGRVPAILRSRVDWPADVLAFAREEIPAHVQELRHGAGSTEGAEDDDSERPPITRFLPRSILGDVARVGRVEEYTLYRALDDLQRRLAERTVELLSNYRLERIAADHVVIEAEESLVADVLAGYDDRTQDAVILAHVRSYPDDRAAIDTPLFVTCSPREIRRVSEIIAE